MLKQLLVILGVLLPVTMSAQDYVWTGAAGNNDFFDELNWQDPVSEENPASGTIDPDVSIDLTLVIRDASPTVVANGDISMGAGGLSVTGTTLSGFTFSSGDLTIHEDGYVLLNGSTPLGTNVKIDFRGSFGWVKLPEVLPSDVLSSCESCFLLSGNAASYPDNIRIDNYYDGGALVRPNLSSLAPLIVYDEPALQGNQSFISVDEIHSGSAIPGSLNNAISSFELKRGFMATLAINEDGTGLSKVFIASEEDLVVENLPLNLNENVSFIRVVPWNWVAKKGIGGNVTGLNETWHYNWSNTGISTINRENVPMSWGKGGADDPSDIELYKSKYKTAHVLAFNESDNCEDQSGQYGDLCNTDVAVATYENLMKTGLRLVSPSCRENAPFGWLKEFYDKATARDIRIDVIGVHWYDWGSNPADSPNADPQQVFNRFKNYLQQVYDLYQLPIWITEFNANPNRTTAVNKAFMELALPYLESLDYVERYAWFEPFSDVADYYDGGGNYTEVGLIYKTLHSTPSIPEVSLCSANNLDDLHSHSVIWADEAENGILGGGTVLKTGCSNASGTEFISLEPGLSSTLTFNSVNVDFAGSYSLTIYHFNANDVVLKFRVNGQNAEVILKASNWCYQGAPGKTTVTVDLKDGLNELLFYDNESVAVLLDRFELFGSVTTNIEPDLEEGWSFYPNPGSHSLRFNSASPLSRVRVYNLNGELVLFKDNVMDMNVSSLSAGIYFIQSGQQVVKFIKK